MLYFEFENELKFYKPRGQDSWAYPEIQGGPIASLGRGGGGGGGLVCTSISRETYGNL